MTIETPGISARFSPIYWEPMAGSGERVTALVAIEPDAGQSNLKAAAHSVLPVKRLKEMLGATRGNSAFGILNEVAEFMSSRLAAGLTLEDLDAPFGGFVVGKARRIRAFSESQLLDSAVQMISAFGQIEDAAIDEIASTKMTATTFSFLKQVQSAFSIDIKDRRSRFFVSFQSEGATRVTIDYAYKKWLVQFASLPSTVGQAPYARREAESKILELITAREFVESATKSILIINRQSVLQHSDEVTRAVLEANESFKFYANRHNVHAVEVGSKDDAVRALEQFA